jgi:hypothetical protein
MSIKVKISNNTRVVTFKVNNNIIKKSYKVKNSLIKYTLGLYFGGNKPTPHDMKIDIK